MTDLPPPAEPADAPRPPSCEDLSHEAEKRPKSLRLLPRITGDAQPRTRGKHSTMAGPG